MISGMRKYCYFPFNPSCADHPDGLYWVDIYHFVIGGFEFERWYGGDASGGANLCSDLHQHSSNQVHSMLCVFFHDGGAVWVRHSNPRPGVYVYQYDSLNLRAFF
jgi:hypothetical protein